jgi:mannose/cellobiose epimerase-like protein (N-acyl-D-glucosamine 2-epimerase family)
MNPVYFATGAVSFVLGAALTAQAALPPGLPTSQRWRSHVQNELLPFWASANALGNPVGNFPTVRCNNGSLINRSNPCPEVNNPYLLQNRTSVVAMSRQVYGYCVAFHMTGNPEYLKYAKAGVDYLRQNAFDRQNGGTHVYRDNASQQWDPQPGLRNTQELSYALLGMSFYHYLTRDPAVLADIVAAKNNIFQKYYNPSRNAIQWQLQDGNGDGALDKRYVAQIDQLSYMFLVTPDLPAAQRQQWQQDITKITNSMVQEFYSPANNLFFLRANNADDKNLAKTGTDFGHTAKGFWKLRLAGRITGNQSLINFSKQNAPGLLDRAYQTGPGAWSVGVKPGGTIDNEKSWWISAELDQLSSVLALDDAKYADRLVRSYDYWFKYFVDPQGGEVWTGIQANSNQPTTGLPKQWQWKNAYHSFEHALFGYITTSQLEQQPATLYYAFKQVPANASLRPHFFQGKLDSVNSRDDRTFGKIYMAKFSNIRF